MLKKAALPLTIIYTITLAVVSLIKLNNVPDVGVDYGDKIFHFLAYCVLTILWFYTFLYNFNVIKRKAIIIAALISVVFGIVIEILQETLTDSRAMDIYDVVANTLGTLLTLVVISVIKINDVKKI